jgi:[ribosomal protein S18]-alanine N-acetyltransferase
MSRAGLKGECGGEGCALVPMGEHDLLEVVEIEETTGLSQWGWEAYRAELARPEAVMLVARGDAPDDSGRSVVAYIASRVSADELHINNIGVREESRRKGLGAALLGAALDEGARRGARLAVLEVREGNAAAQALYGRFGFEVVGRRRGYYRSPVEDALIMTRALAPAA